MDGFRLSLLVIGILVVLVIYVMGRRREGGGLSLFALFGPLLRRAGAARQRRRREAADPELDPGVDSRVDSGVDAGDWDAMPLRATGDDGEVFDDIHLQAVDQEEAAADGEEFILVLRILAPRGEVFSGTAIREAAQAMGMRHGDMDIFHLYTEVQPPIQPRVICSLANGVEPGHFHLDEMDGLTTPGLTLFLQLPGPLDGREAFEKMLELGRRLAQHLGGELYDESRSVLTAQTVSHLKERLEAWRFRSRMAQIRRRHH